MKSPRMINTFIRFCYDDASDAAAKAAADKAAADATAKAAADKAAADEANKGKFSQNQVDDIVQKRLLKQSNSNKATLEQLETMKANQTLSDEEKTNLQETIDRIKSESMTKDQLAAEERKRITDAAEEDRVKLQTRGDSWKELYHKTTIETEILQAASTVAENPSQILTALKGQTELVKVIGTDGKPTGEMKTIVNWPSKDDAGKDVVLQLTVAEAIKKHSEIKENWNLYKSNLSGGFGGGNFHGGNAGDTTITDTEYFANELKRMQS